MSISPYLNPDSIFFFNASNRDEAIKQIVEHLASSNQIENKEAFFEAIIKRETLVSTGIGMGIAIPHAKIPQYDHFFIAIGILESAVDWNAIDGAPVKVIILIGGPDDKQTEYLQLLSVLTQAIKNENRRKKLLNTHDINTIIELFQEI